MSVYVVFTDTYLESSKRRGEQQIQDGKYEDDEKVDYSYQTTDAGLLRLLAASKDKDDWRVLGEFAPSAWVQVSGKRYTTETGRLGGFLGGVVERREDPLQGLPNL